MWTFIKLCTIKEVFVGVLTSLVARPKAELTEKFDTIDNDFQKSNITAHNATQSIVVPMGLVGSGVGSFWVFVQLIGRDRNKYNTTPFDALQANKYEYDQDLLKYDNSLLHAKNKIKLETNTDSSTNAATKHELSSRYAAQLHAQNIMAVCAQTTDSIIQKPILALMSAIAYARNTLDTTDPGTIADLQQLSEHIEEFVREGANTLSEFYKNKKAEILEQMTECIYKYLITQKESCELDCKIAQDAEKIFGKQLIISIQNNTSRDTAETRAFEKIAKIYNKNNDIKNKMKCFIDIDKISKQIENVKTLATKNNTTINKTTLEQCSVPPGTPVWLNEIKPT